MKKYQILQKEVRRGGEATLHTPGQLIIYPVLYLPAFSLKVKDFISTLEIITQKLLKDFGIVTNKEGSYAGLYTQRGKISFFGIHISHGVSQHGLAINVHNDLNLFQSIRSCGEPNRQHDKLSFYSQFSMSKKDLFFKWCKKALDELTSF